MTEKELPKKMEKSSKKLLNHIHPINLAIIIASLCLMVFFGVFAVLAIIYGSRSLLALYYWYYEPTFRFAWGIVGFPVIIFVGVILLILSLKSIQKKITKDEQANKNQLLINMGQLFIGGSIVGFLLTGAIVIFMNGWQFFILLLTYLFMLLVGWLPYW